MLVPWRVFDAYRGGPMSRVAGKIGMFLVIALSAVAGLAAVVRA